MTTSITNEYTSLQKYKSLTLYFRKGDVLLCVRDELETGTHCYILTQVLLATIAAILPHLGWGCSIVGHWGPKPLCLPLALTSASCLQLIWTVCAPGYIFDYRSPASAVFPLIYTGASLDWRLGRGSVYDTTFYDTTVVRLCYDPHFLAI